MTQRFIPSTLTAALTLLLLSACGESDIEGIEQRELDAAQRAIASAEQSAEQSAENPDTEPDVGAPKQP